MGEKRVDDGAIAIGTRVPIRLKLSNETRIRGFMARLPARAYRLRAMGDLLVEAAEAGDTWAVATWGLAMASLTAQASDTLRPLIQEAAKASLMLEQEMLRRYRGSVYGRRPAKGNRPRGKPQKIPDRELVAAVNAERKKGAGWAKAFVDASTALELSESTVRQRFRRLHPSG